MHEPSEQLDLRAYLRPVYARRWLILALVVLSTGVTYYLSSKGTKEYTAFTAVYTKFSETDRFITGGDSFVVDPERQVGNEARLAGTRAVADDVARRIGYDGPPGGLIGSYFVSAEEDLDFVRITALNSDPEQAARIANGVAEAFIALRTRAQQQRARQALRVARQQLAAVPTGEENDDIRRSIRARIGALELVESTPGVSAEQIDPATPPAVPSSPRPRRDAFFAAILALVFGLFVAYLLERLSRRITEADDLERMYGFPVLGTVPHCSEAEPFEDGGLVLDGHLKESFRALRVSIALASHDRPLKTLLVTSAVPGEGKSMLVRNLALTYREAGLRVAVVDCDLRRPTVAKRFHVESEPGLTDVLSGRVVLWDVLRDAHMVLPEGDILPRVLATDQPSGGNSALAAEMVPGCLRILPSGPTSANPQAVLATETMRQVIEALGREHDIVLIDTPPILAVTDVVPLVSMVDGVLVVSRVGVTARHSAHQLSDAVAKIPEKSILGVVANDLPEKSLDSRYSNYSVYGYGYETSKSG